MNEEKLLVKKAQKNPKAFSELYEKYHPRIFGYIRKRVNSKELAEDLTGATFEKAISKISQFQWEGVSFGAWLYRIARNTVYDHFRSARTRKSANLSEEREDQLESDADIADAAERDEHELLLYKHIGEMEEKDQYLLFYRYFEGRSVKEVAKMTGMSEANVATRLHRIRKQLKEGMEEVEF